MTDISERRRRAGRWALAAGAALALPLTATVVYAGQDAPEVAPVAPAAPEAPTPPEAKKVEKRVIVMHHEEHDGDAKHGKEAKFERKLERDGKTIVIRSDKPIDEAELEAKIAPMLDMTQDMVDISKRREPGDKRVVRKIIMHDLDGKGPHDGHALAFAMAKCKDGPAIADADASRETGDASTRTVNRTRILLCGKEGLGKVEALAKVRAARDRIAASDKMSAEMRADILRQLDESIARLEKGGE